MAKKKKCFLTADHARAQPVSRVRQAKGSISANGKGFPSKQLQCVINLWDSLPKEVVKANIVHEITKDLLKIVEDFVGIT